MDVNAPTPAVWQPPSYNAGRSPALKHTASIWRDDYSRNNFVRCAKWCPDGSVALAQCENATFQYLDIPQPLISDVSPVSFKSPAGLPQSSPILDFAWYPYASPVNPASFCFLASVRECPVKLLDAVDGRLRASYKIVDHRERQVAPHSLAFNGTATKIYCGFEDAIEVFDTQYPGEGTRWHTTPSKKSRDGLKGIISSLAFSSDTSSGVFAAGSLSPSSPSSSNVAIFTEATGETPVMYVSNESAGNGIGVRSSVSQVMFNPARPYMLYASFRRHDYIYSWDLRGDVSSSVQRFLRTRASNGLEDLFAHKPAVVETNQRLRFDVDVGGKWLAVGNQDGEIAMFDLGSSASEAQSNADGITEAPCTKPSLTYEAHNDAVGSVAFHPSRPLLLSVSGSRHFDEAPSHDRADSNSDSSDGSDADVQDEPSTANMHATLITRSRVKPTPIVQDASAKLWSFEPSTS